VSNKIFFSGKNCGFYFESIKALYLEADTWPADVVEITAEDYAEFQSTPPSGMRLGCVDGKPCWRSLVRDKKT
jgi:hypothetical protein